MTRVIKKASMKFTLLCVYILFVSIMCEQNVNDTRVLDEADTKVLSRRKRFIVFPEGSSVQLVFCLTYPTIFAIGDIFLYGYTSALAWELPQDPYSPFMHHADPLHRRVDVKNIYYVDYDGKLLYKKPYTRKPIVNPAFAKRSVNEAANVNAAEFKKGIKTDRQQMHRENRREFLKTEHMEGLSVEFHRTSRAALYEKMESLLKALGVDGRQCMLKVLCRVGQTQHQEQSSFFQELLRALFTLPQGSEFNNDYHKEYDVAHTATESCDELYPDCDESSTHFSIPE